MANVPAVSNLKISWAGDHQSLKNFVEKALKLNGEWTNLADLTFAIVDDDHLKSVNNTITSLNNTRNTVQPHVTNAGATSLSLKLREINWMYTFFRSNSEISKGISDLSK